jgi:carbon monoxide dehydrogenase subunit G
MPTFQQSIDIAATPERVWKVLGDLASVSRWIPGVTGVTLTDTGRVCAFEDGHTQTELILDYSPQTRSYRYIIEGAPLPVSKNTGSFAVEYVEHGARVVWQSRFVPLDPAMESNLTEMWAYYLPIVLANLKTLVENS